MRTRTSWLAPVMALLVGFLPFMVQVDQTHGQVFAEYVPNLQGTWVGNGKVANFTNPETGEVEFTPLDMTLQIDSQEALMFSGTLYFSSMPGEYGLPFTGTISLMGVISITTIGGTLGPGAVCTAFYRAGQNKHTPPSLSVVMQFIDLGATGSFTLIKQPN